MKVYKLGISLILILSIAACSDEEKPVSLPAEDFAILKKLAEVCEQAEIIWPGYAFCRSNPAYIILNDGGLSNPRGYLMNPPQLPKGTSKIDGLGSIELELYRNDNFLLSANELLGDFGNFNFDQFKINGGTYFLIRQKALDKFSFYDEFKNVDNNWLPLVLVHEGFHVYQVSSWTYPQDVSQDFQNYPITKDILTYELALADLMQQAFTITKPDEAELALEKYVALYDHIISIDPTEGKVSRRMGRFQQWLEGSARYIEHFAAHGSIYPTINNDPTHGWGDYIDQLNSRELIRHIFAVRLWYHIGAAAIHLLKTMGVPVEVNLMQGKTPFDLAVKQLNLSANEKESLIEEMKNQSAWSSYESKATYLFGL